MSTALPPDATPEATPGSDPITGAEGPADEVTYGGQRFRAAPTRRRGRETVRDMVISMAVVGAGVVVLLVLAWRPTPEAGVKPVDWQPTAALAKTAAQYPIVTPEGLSDRWRVTSARFEPEATSLGRPVWHLGFVTPSDAYAGVEQSDADAAVFVAKVVSGGRPEGEVTIAGQPWQSYGPGSNGYRSLVRSSAGSTVVVTGGADLAELEALAASLAPAAG